MAPLRPTVALPVAATARWSNDSNLHAGICYLNPAATRTSKLRFIGDALELRTMLSGAFAPPEEVTLMGRAA